ncbi:MAG: hypothetical protein ACFE0Q_04000 [Anaerolineae bacterium]
MLDTIWQWTQWIFLFGCVLPLVVTLILGGLLFYFGQKWVADFIDPDLSKLQEKMTQIKAKRPDISDGKLIDKVVHQQAFKCGVVGAVTGFGGFVTLPISLPVDMLLTARFQASMVSFIAQVYGYEESLENKAATYAVITGSTELTKVSTAVIRKYAPQMVGKSFSKLIPVLGALIAFIVNYVMARSMATAAKRWYAGNTREVVMAKLAL